MATSIYRCPTTGLMVQGWFADDDCDGGAETYEGLTCLFCRRLHFINPRTGDMAGRGLLEEAR
jgi:hypothetical protein